MSHVKTVIIQLTEPFQKFQDRAKEIIDRNNVQRDPEELATTLASVDTDDVWNRAINLINRAEEVNVIVDPLKIDTKAGVVTYNVRYQMILSRPNQIQDFIKAYNLDVIEIR